jgi:hypothetical protein
LGIEFLKGKSGFKGFGGFISGRTDQLSGEVGLGSDGLVGSLVEFETVTNSLLPAGGGNEVKGAGIRGQRIKQELPLKGSGNKFKFDNSLHSKLTIGKKRNKSQRQEDGASSASACAPKG